MSGVYLTNKELRALLVDRGACPYALRWLGKRDLPTAWMECPDAGWMAWLIDYCGDVIGVPVCGSICDLEDWRYNRGATAFDSPDAFRAKLTPRMVKR